MLSLRLWKGWSWALTSSGEQPSCPSGLLLGQSHQRFGGEKEREGRREGKPHLSLTFSPCSGLSTPFFDNTSNSHFSFHRTALTSRGEIAQELTVPVKNEYNFLLRKIFMKKDLKMSVPRRCLQMQRAHSYVTLIVRSAIFVSFYFI